MESSHFGGTSGRALNDHPVVYLHVGGPKTGTTYLQSILWHNRVALREDGVLYPGDYFAAHVHAAFDLRDAGFRGAKDPWVVGAWKRFVDEARSSGGAVVISHELFAPSTAEQVDRALADLNFAEVHVVYTVRDLTRQIPAAWQEDIKNRGVSTFDEFVEGQLDPVENHVEPAQRFWRVRDAIEVLDRWTRDIPYRRVHVVTVPPPDAPKGLLWERFAGLIGVDPGRYDTSVARGNLSLGPDETNLLRSLNVALDGRIDWPTYNRFVKHHLAQQVLTRRSGPARIALSEAQHARAAAQSKELAEEIRARGYDVVGDLDELTSAPPAEASAQSAAGEPSGGSQLDAAVEGMAGLLEHMGRTRQRGVRAEDLERELAQRRSQPIKTIVRDLSERNRALMRARVAWWHLVERWRKRRASDGGGSAARMRSAAKEDVLHGEVGDND